MIQRQLKLKLTPKQARKCETWLFQSAGIYNWIIRKIEQDAEGGIYWTYFGLTYEVKGHSRKCGVPVMMIQGTIKRAVQSWERCYKKLGRKPKLKSARNRMNGIDILAGVRKKEENKIFIPILGEIRYHKDSLPEGKIKACRLLKKASGWHLAVCIDAEPESISCVSNGEIGIDPGFSSLLTLSNGEKIKHPRELEKSADKLAKAQRGGNKRLTARIHERIANQRRDRNHKLSRKLVSENELIVFSDDCHKAIARSFGKSVTSSGHAQLRQMLAYKCRTDGRKYIEVASRNSTRTCSACGALSGPAGYAGLSVREWVCGCGAKHDRDVNAAINTLTWGQIGPRNSEITFNEMRTQVQA